MTTEPQARPDAELDPSIEMTATAARIRALVDEQDAWRTGTLNLVASENRLGPATRELLASDLSGRVAMSVTSPQPFPGLRAVRDIAQIWRIMEDLCRRLTGGAYVDPRPVAVTQANLIAMAATTTPGDTIAVQSIRGGGSESYNTGALPDYLGLRAVTLPTTDVLGIDIVGAAEIVRRERPKAIVIGGMKVLFPYPVRELRALADEVGATLVYDAAHLIPLIATDLFQRPLAEGAHILTGGTHKMAGGPMGGLLATNDATLAARLEEVTTVFVEGRDVNKIAASAHAFAEMVAFAEPYSAACLANARALARVLKADGHAVLGADRGYTQTHQVMLSLAGACSGHEAVERCAERDIFLSPVRLPSDDAYPAPTSGIRISVQEITRLGFEPDDMPAIGRLIGRAIREDDDPDAGRASVAALGLAGRPMRFVLG